MMKNKKELLSCAICVAFITGVSAEESNAPLFALPVGVGSAATSVQTSMHDAGSAAASYTLGSGGSNVQTTQGYSGGESSGGNDAAYSTAPADSGNSNTASSSSGRSGSSSSSRGSSRRVRSSAGATAQGGGYVPPSYGGEKDAAVPIPMAAQPSPISLFVEGGYQSDYVYRGLSQIENAVAPDYGKDGSEMYFVGFGLQWNGLTAGVKYVRSEASRLNPRFEPSTTRHETYEEYVFDINYTLGLIAGPQGAGNWLDVTLGYQMIYFTEETFWNTDIQHDFYATVRVNRYQWFRPSVSYHYYEQGDALNSGTIAPGAEILTGQQLIFQIEGSGLLHDAGRVQFGVGYYAHVGYDKMYNGSTSSFTHDWNQYGINFPITFDGLTVTPSINYTDRNGGGINEDLWWGLKMRYTF